MAFSGIRNVSRLITTTGFSTQLIRPLSFRSAISLDKLYPNSSLKITTATHKPDPDAKFSGYIPMDKLDIKYSASSGPGGQNVNKVHTKVDLRFKLNEADWLHPDVKARLLHLHEKQLTKEGYLVIRSDATRSQQLNTADCLRKLRTLIWSALETNKEPSPDSIERVRQRHLKAARLRLAEKREASNKRALTRPPTLYDL